MRRITGLLVLGLALVGACNSDSTSPSGGTLTGSYSLRTVNGSALPYNFPNGLVLVSETLTLGSNGSYTDVATYNSGQTSTEFGSYSALNNSVTFHDQTDGITYSGSVSADVLTEISNGYTSVYQRN